VTPFTVIIPARYASTRLPGKPLADIAGKPMVVRVALRAQQAGADRVVVATDDERIKATVEAHGIAAACHPIDDEAEAFNPNVVKVVLDHRNYALYFSRATIPWARDAFAGGPAAVPRGLPIYRHYGLYAYRAGFLRAYPTLAPAGVERFEALEQLRALWHGYRIIVEVTTGTPAPGIDTLEDLERVRALFAAGAV